jgi:choline kinase
MIGLILAAGRGSRLGDLTVDRPKCLTTLAGKALLDYQLQALRGGGCTEIGIVTGFSSDSLRGRGDFQLHNQAWATTNMVGTLEVADKLLSERDVIVSYSDIVFEPAAVSNLIHADARLAMTYDVNWESLWRRRFGDPLLDAETLRIDAAGRLLEIGRKPSGMDEIEGQYMGLLKISPSGWATLQEARRRINVSMRSQQSMTALLDTAIELTNAAIRAVPYSGWWFEIDTPKDLELAETDLPRANIRFFSG